VDTFGTTGAFQMQIDHIAQSDAPLLHGMEVMEHGVFLGSSTFRMRAVVPFKVLRRTALNAVILPCGQEQMQMGLFLCGIEVLSSC
jgi:hypothetical protein